MYMMKKKVVKYNIEIGEKILGKNIDRGKQ